jgi:hypothetical protein
MILTPAMVYIVVYLLIYPIDMLLHSLENLSFFAFFTAILSAVQFRPLRAFLPSDESAAESQPDRCVNIHTDSLEVQ